MRAMSEKTGDGHLAVLELKGHRGEGVSEGVERYAFQFRRFANPSEQFCVRQLPVASGGRKREFGFLRERERGEKIQCGRTDRSNLLACLGIAEPEASVVGVDL